MWICVKLAMACSSLFYILVCLCAFSMEELYAASAKEICAYFRFPTMSSNTFISEENITANFTFVLENKSCRSLNNAFIIIENHSTKFCEINLNEEGCTGAVPEKLCKCEFKSGQFRFMKVINRSDNGVWKWRARDVYLRVIAEHTITFKVTSLPRITNLTVNGFGHIRTVLQNQNVQVVCSLDPGYPPVAARLLGSSGKILSDLRDSNGSITHMYSAVTCHDAGNIRCEANGAERNMSVTLLVQCPPVFVNDASRKLNASFGQSIDLRLSVRMHSSSIRKCQLSSCKEELLTKSNQTRSVYNAYECYVQLHQEKSDSGDQRSKEMCRCHVNGTAPELTLNVRLDNVIIEASGNWSVTLTNDVGDGKTELFIQLVEVPAQVISLTINGHNGTEPRLVLQNQQVQFVCAWVNGNPPVTVHLLGSHGNSLINNSAQNGTMNYHFPATCHDAGIIRCQADRAVRNVSAVLLVECSPRFANISVEAVAIEGQDQSLHFHVRTHSSTVSECKITKHSGEIKMNGDIATSYFSYTCKVHNEISLHNLKSNTDKCVCIINGTAPDFQLYLQMFHITLKDDGKWRATLTNTVGSGEIEFYIYVSAVVNINMVAAAAVGTIAFTVFCIIVIVSVFYFKRGRVYEHPTRPRHQEAVAYRSYGLGAERDETLQIQKTDNSYEEIREIREGATTPHALQSEINNYEIQSEINNYEIQSEINNYEIQLENYFNASSMATGSLPESLDYLQPCNDSVSTSSPDLEKPHYLKPIHISDT